MSVVCSCSKRVFFSPCCAVRTDALWRYLWLKRKLMIRQFLLRFRLARVQRCSLLEYRRARTKRDHLEPSVKAPPSPLYLSLSSLLSFSVGDALDEDDLDAELACLDDELDVSDLDTVARRILCWLDDLTWGLK